MTMNSWRIGISKLKEIAAASNKDVPVVEACGLYSAARTLIADIAKHVIDEKGQPDTYLSEKLGKTKWHIGAMLGFDIDNGHPRHQHCSWLLGELMSAEQVLSRIFPEE